MVGGGAGAALAVVAVGAALDRDVSTGTTAGGVDEAGCCVATIGPGSWRPSFDDDRICTTGRSGTAVGEVAVPCWG